MELTASVVEDEAAAYAAEEPLYAVEAEQVEGLPGAFASGDFGWRDAEWVVRWYYRRFLGGFPDDRRREAESAFGENGYGAVRDALEAARAADDAVAAVGHLTALSGVDVPVATAFLMFLDPDRYVVVGEREWTVLHEADELAEPAPDRIEAADYATYLGACRGLADRLDCTLWTLYRALWRRWKAEYG